MNGHPNDFLLSRWLSKETTWWEGWRLKRHLDRCPMCRERLATMEAERAQYDSDPERRVEIMALAARVPRTPAAARAALEQAPPRRGPEVAGGWIVAAMTLLIVGGSLALAFSPTGRALWETPPGSDGAQTDFRPKGSDVFVMYLERGQGAQPIPDQCRAGDRLRARLSSRHRFVFVIGQDGTGAYSPLHPMGGDTSAPLPPEGMVTPGSWVLDQTPGTERFSAIFSDAPLSFDAAKAMLQHESTTGTPATDQRAVVIHQSCTKVQTP